MTTNLISNRFRWTNINNFYKIIPALIAIHVLPALVGALTNTDLFIVYKSNYILLPIIQSFSILSQNLMEAIDIPILSSYKVYTHNFLIFYQYFSINGLYSSFVTIF